jgi:D-threo-aldose 1-dehydrogenase
LTPRPTFNYAAADGPWLEKALRLQSVCDRHQVCLAAAALQFALAHPATQIVLLGARSPGQWHEARTHLRQTITPSFWQALRREGLLPEEAPTP